MKERIADVKHRLAKIESMKEYQVELERRFEENQEKMKIASQILKKESKDVEKLQSASFANVIAWLKKDKEERLAKEESEANHAMIAYKQIQDENESLNDELVHCEEEIAKEGELLILLEQLLKEEAMHGPYREQLKPLYENLEKEQRLEKELQEAIEASYIVTEELRLAIRQLDDASTWGAIDLFGGGLISSMIKHSHVNSAQSSIAQIQQDMLRFQKELKDINHVEIASVNMEGWLYFADVFFDGVIFDYMALSKIKQNQGKIKECYHNIVNIQDQLLDEKCNCLDRQINLKEKIDTIV